MTAAQVAWCCLTALFLAAGTTMYLLDAELVGGLLIAVATLGYLLLAVMITNDAVGRTSTE